MSEQPFDSYEAAFGAFVEQDLWSNSNAALIERDGGYVIIIITDLPAAALA